jgi:hypothetical protein
MHPAPGRFDFTEPLRRLDEALAKGRGVVFRMDTFVVKERTPWGESPPAVPSWLLASSPPRIADMAAGDDDTYPDCLIHIAVPWDPAIRRAHLEFIEALGNSGVPKHPALIGFYVHGISTSLGEEFWFTRSAYGSLKAAGMTATVLESSFAERLEAWARAFGDRVGRLAWVGAGWMDVPEQDWEAYRATGERLDKLALSLGMGWRGGGIEWANQLFEGQGQRLGEDGYVRTDRDHPLLKDGRYFGDENEIWNPKSPHAAAGYRASVLKALAVGMRTLWTSDAAVELDPGVSSFFNRTAGRGPADAVDAWAWLRETVVRRKGTAVPVRNLERGLIQREAPGFGTRIALWTERPRWWGDGDRPGDFLARRTDRARGNRGIGLAVETAFRERMAGDLDLHVTWLDDGTAWFAEYSAADGIARTPALKGPGGGVVRTATLPLPGFQPRRPIAERFDLALYPIEGDLTVLFVRISRR